MKDLEKSLRYVSSTTLKNLEREAFKEILKIMTDFFYNCLQSPDLFYWVCTAFPGHGKTTALICAIKSFVRQTGRSQRLPLLIALKDTEHIDTIYKNVHRDFPDNFITYLDHSNKKQQEPNLSRYQIVLITHQRLKDLVMGFGNINAYLTWKPSRGHRSIQRALISDEKPMFYDGAIFDIGDNDNSVKWFDECAKGSDLSLTDKILGRSAIAIMLAKELAENPTTVTLPLINRLNKTGLLRDFKRIIKQLDVKNISLEEAESFKKMQWFMKLVKEQGIGRIDKTREGNRIICTTRVDYRKLKMPILILDGTAEYTPLQYNNEYEYKTVKNRIDYNRLYIHQKLINTSADKRKSASKTVQKAIADDIRKLRENGKHPFPLVAKNDIGIYKKEGVIDSRYVSFYEEDSNSDGLPLNLHNTTGKNRLKDENILYLTSMPLMKPEYYKQIAISLFDSADFKVNLDMAGNEEGRWFKDTLVEDIFKECVISELIQIIHRTKLRMVKNDEKIHIALATKNTPLVQGLVDALSIPVGNFKLRDLFDGGLYRFDEKVRAMAIRWVEYGLLYEKSFDKGFPCFLSVLSDKDKDFVNYNWNKQDKSERINRILEEYNLRILTVENGWKKVDWLDEEEIKQRNKVS